MHQIAHIILKRQLLDQKIGHLLIPELIHGRVLYIYNVSSFKHFYSLVHCYVVVGFLSPQNITIASVKYIGMS